MFSKKIVAITIATIIATPLFYTQSVQAKEFKVNCSSVKDCMSKGDRLVKRKKLSLALEAYRNAIKKDVSDKNAWRKFEKITVRISEEGGC